MKTLQEALRLISESKKFYFEKGANGDTVLVITNYYSGEKLFLDLYKLDEKSLEKLQIAGSTEDLEERCRTYIHDNLTDKEEENLELVRTKQAEYNVSMSRIDYDFYTYLCDLAYDFCGYIGIDTDEDFDIEDFINNQFY